MSDKDKDGTNKAAILMLALGEEQAAEVMKFLGPREVLKLGAAMAQMKAVQHEQVVTVLEEFVEETNLHSTVGLDSDEYIRQVLTKALGTGFVTTAQRLDGHRLHPHHLLTARRPG